MSLLYKIDCYITLNALISIRLTLGKIIPLMIIKEFHLYYTVL